jgi:hypothetical protein
MSYAEKLGQLELLKQKERRLINQAKGILGAIGQAAYVSPLASPFDLNPMTISDHAADFNKVHAEGIQVRIAIDNLKSELGQS